jgi:hypothetical protein
MSPPTTNSPEPSAIGAPDSAERPTPQTGGGSIRKADKFVMMPRHEADMGRAKRLFFVGLAVLFLYAVYCNVRDVFDGTLSPFHRFFSGLSGVVFLFCSLRSCFEACSGRKPSK